MSFSVRRIDFCVGKKLDLVYCDYKKNEGEISLRLTTVLFKSYSLWSDANGAYVFLLRIICLFYCFRDATFVQFCRSFICCRSYVSFQCFTRFQYFHAMSTCNVRKPHLKTSLQLNVTVNQRNISHGQSTLVTTQFPDRSFLGGNLLVLFSFYFRCLFPNITFILTFLFTFSFT